MTNIISKSFELFVAQPLSLLRDAIVQIVGIQSGNPQNKSVNVSMLGRDKIQMTVVNSEKMCNLLMTVAYKKRLLAEKKLNENQASKVHN